MTEVLGEPRCLEIRAYLNSWVGAAFNHDSDEVTPMVFLAITSNGLESAIQLAARTGDSVWCGADAIPETDDSQQSRRGVSRFNYSLQGEDQALIQDALETIQEHHPGEVIWIEGIPR